ncbi:hypothetical protein BC827DRAFT_1234647 [Russula dissimulans]|nr:hypothetical protein BC827DRAFT_1234647 [Russula dissimulans]
MSPTTTPPSNFQSIFDAALTDYAKKTGIDLATYPFARTLENCRSASDILDLFQRQANQFRTYRDRNHKLINSLTPVVLVLHSISGILAKVSSVVSLETNSFHLVLYFTLPSGAIPTFKSNPCSNRCSACRCHWGPHKL